MKHRHFLLFVPLFLPACGAGNPAAGQPNILWLTSEDHGPQMGCYGDASARTPNVDALAARGMLFNHAWSTHPVCAPARTAIISGMYATSTGGLHMRSMAPMPSGVKMFPQYLREAGYYCTNNSKEDYNLGKPEGVWDKSSRDAHWQNRPRGRPFFAIFNSVKSHESEIRSRPHQLVTDPAGLRLPAYHPDTPEVRRDWAQYYDKVSEADADAGARLKEIEDAGLADDTIVFYFADHGSGMPRSKRWPSNSGLHAPMVIFFPEKWRHLAPKEYEPGGKSDRLVGFVDLAPTVLSIAGIRPPDVMQGRAFAGPFQTEPQPFLSGSRGRMDECQDNVRSITDGRYVYLRSYLLHVSQGQHVGYQFETPTTRIWRDLFDRGKTNAAQSIFWRTPRAPEELYDLQTDPDEVTNLADSPQHRAVLEKLRQAQHAHAARIRDVCFLPEGEIHSRSRGRAPYDMARDGAQYPFRRIFEAAELASRLDDSAVPRLADLMSDSDSAVRYWAALGFLMRGAKAVNDRHAVLLKALKDESPYVRIVAAEALGLHGPESGLPSVLAVLGSHALSEHNGVFVAMSALMSIEALGAKAAPLHELIRTMKQQGPSPHPRYDSYIPRLVAKIGLPPVVNGRVGNVSGPAGSP